MTALSIVHLCNLPLPETHPDFERILTHPGRWVLNLALAQKAHTDINPILVVQVPGASANHVQCIEGVDVHFVAAPDRLRSATLFHFDAKRLSKYVRNIDPDLVHAHGTEDAYALSALATGLPYVITVQGCLFIINRLARPPLISRNTIVQLIERYVLRRASHVIAKSKYVQKELTATFPNLCLHEIPNTFDPRLLEIDSTKGLVPKKIAFVGTVIPRKGFDLLIDAVASLPESLISVVELHVFGNHSGQPSDYEKRELERARSILGDRLVLHGILPAIEVAKHVAGCSLLVAPSREEMFGNQVIEAMLVGTAVLVADQTAMAENVRRFGGGSVAPQEDALAFGKGIQAVLEASSRTTESARNRIVKAMGPSTIALAHREVYEEICKNGRR